MADVLHEMIKAAMDGDRTLQIMASAKLAARGGVADQAVAALFTLDQMTRVSHDRDKRRARYGFQWYGQRAQLA